VEQKEHNAKNDTLVLSKGEERWKFRLIETEDGNELKFSRAREGEDKGPLRESFFVDVVLPFFCTTREFISSLSSICQSTLW
jgi:hypothetical protein